MQRAQRHAADATATAAGQMGVGKNAVCRRICIARAATMHLPQGGCPIIIIEEMDLGIIRRLDESNRGLGFFNSQAKCTTSKNMPSLRLPWLRTTHDTCVSCNHITLEVGASVRITYVRFLDSQAQCP